jgi:hypothetical protein
VKYDSVLKKLENDEITAEEALEELYPVKKVRMGKKAYFVKMKIHVPEEGKGVNTFLKILFAIPFPMIFARIGLRFGQRFIKDDDIDISEISKMLKYSKNSIINVDSKDAQIEIKVI